MPAQRRRVGEDRRARGRTAARRQSVRPTGLRHHRHLPSSASTRWTATEPTPPGAGLLGGTHHRVRLQPGDGPDQAVVRVVAERVERPANPGHPLQPFGCLPEPPGEAGGLRGGPYRGVGAVHPTTAFGPSVSRRVITTRYAPRHSGPLRGWGAVKSSPETPVPSDPAFVPFVGGCEPGGSGDEGGGAGNSAAGGLLPVVTGNPPQWPRSWPAVEHVAVTALNVSAGRRGRHERIRTKFVTPRGTMTNSPSNAAGLLVRSRPRSLDLLGFLACCEPIPGVAVRRHRRRTKPGRP